MAAGTGSLDKAGTALSISDKLTGLVSFSAAVLLLRILPFRATLTAARLAGHLARRPASQQEARKAIAARDWTMRWSPGRAACLENSLASFLFAASHRQRAVWCIGCRFLPAESHAWIQAGDIAVGEPDLPGRPFHVTVRI